MTLAGADIRPLGPGEVATARTVITESFRRYLALIGLDPDTEPNPYDYLDAAVADGRAWAGLAGDRIVGIAQVDVAADGAWIVDLVGVLEAYAGSGLGRRLMARIEDDARARGVPALRLSTLEKATWLWQFYQRLGFAILRVAPPDHGQDPNPRVFMEKPLAP